LELIQAVGKDEGVQDCDPSEGRPVDKCALHTREIVWIDTACGIVLMVGAEAMRIERSKKGRRDNRKADE